MRSLDAFLGDHQQRVRGTRRTRPAPSGGFFMDPSSRLAGRDASGPAAKRPRVEEAVKQEDQRYVQRISCLPEAHVSKISLLSTCFMTLQLAVCTQDIIPVG